MTSVSSISLFKSNNTLVKRKSNVFGPELFDGVKNTETNNTNREDAVIPQNNARQFIETRLASSCPRVGSDHIWRNRLEPFQPIITRTGRSGPKYKWKGLPQVQPVHIFLSQWPLRLENSCKISDQAIWKRDSSIKWWKMKTSLFEIHQSQSQSEIGRMNSEDEIDNG